MTRLAGAGLHSPRAGTAESEGPELPTGAELRAALGDVPRDDADYMQAREREREREGERKERGREREG